MYTDGEEHSSSAEHDHGHEHGHGHGYGLRHTKSMYVFMYICMLLTLHTVHKTAQYNKYTCTVLFCSVPHRPPGDT
jgi:hypothetical protein